MDINLNYSEGDTPIALKSDFILSFCELIMGGKNGLEAVEKTLIDRAVISVYRSYLADPKPENMPILGDLYNEIKKQPEKEAQRIASALELYVLSLIHISKNDCPIRQSGKRRGAAYRTGVTESNPKVFGAEKQTRAWERCV